MEHKIFEIIGKAVTGLALVAVCEIPFFIWLVR